MRSPSPARTRGEIARATAASVASALGWVVAGTISIAIAAVGLVLVLALARAAHPTAPAASLWALALVLVFGAPFILATWKHGGDPRRIRKTMTWLPAAWNAAGLALTVILIPDVTGAALRGVEWVVQGHLGDDHSATRAMNALGHEAADMLTPADDAAAKPATSGTLHGGKQGARVDGEAPLTQRTLAAFEDADLGRAITVPFAGTGSSIPIQIELEGERGAVEASYLFDTGASYTTITTAMATELGIPVPDDAPTLEFNTALGRRHSQMVFLPALTVGDVRIEGLLVSICDTCANESTAGLLGLNVMREFFVEMDYQGRTMQLLPRLHGGRPDRAYDIEPVITLEIEGKPEIWLGRIRWILTATNRGTVAIEGVVPRVVFDNGTVLRGEPIARIEAGATGRSLVIGKVTEHEPGKSLEFTLSLAEAYW